jgi:tRNA 5-methylaminomethyl-2-thiouridine biosynthesis bifunctional protein
MPDSLPFPASAPRNAVVLGAGLAGAAICHALCARGWQVTLIERQAQAAEEASGNLIGIVMPVLSQDDNLTSRLTRAAYLFALRYWQTLGQFDHATCGVLQLARDAEHAQLQLAIAQRWKFPATFARWCNGDEASALLGRATVHGGWHFPQGGWADPGAVCRAMLAACGTRLTQQYGWEVASLRRDEDQWHLYDSADVQLAAAPVVIFANSNGATRFAQLADLPLVAVRGQVTHVAADRQSTVPMVVCGEGYVTPPLRGICCVGASYDTHADAHLRADSQAGNLQRVQAMLPGFWPDPDALPLAGRVGFRCVAPDRLPLVGALPDTANMTAIERMRDMPRHPGLYGLLGYASRGLIWAPLAAEMLAAQLEGTPLPLDAALAAALDPARFRLKVLRRQPR